MKILHEIVQCLFARKGTIICNTRHAVRRKHPTDIGDIGKVIGAQGDAERRKFAERFGHCLHSILLTLEELPGYGVGVVRLLEQAIYHKCLVVDTESLQFVRRTRSLFQRCDIRTTYQHETGCRSIGECAHSLLVNLFALFQTRQLAEARRAVRTFADEGTPCRGQLEHPQGVSRRSRVENNMGVLLLNLRICDEIGKGIERCNLHRAGAG